MESKILKSDFKFSPNGIDVISYKKGDTLDGPAAEAAEKQGRIVKPKRKPAPTAPATPAFTAAETAPLETATAPLTLETKA